MAASIPAKKAWTLAPSASALGSSREREVRKLRGVKLPVLDQIHAGDGRGRQWSMDWIGQGD